MRRTLITLWMTAMFLIVVAVPAAQAQESYPPTTEAPAVEGTSGDASATAFTGDDLTSAVIAGAALLGLGAVSLVVARRRASQLMGR